MKNIVSSIVFLTLLVFVVLIIILSTIGIETNKFNKLISNKASQTQNIDLKLNSVKFKIDPKKINLFLETQNPKIIYRNVSVPILNIKVYVDFLSLIKSETKIKKIILSFNELNIAQINELSPIIKPSNFKSLLNNRVKKGKLLTEIEIFLSEEGLFKDFIAKGTVKNLKISLYEDLHLSNTGFSFFADKDDILIQNVLGNIDETKISSGNIKLNLENGVNLVSNFNSEINLNENFFNKYSSLLDKYNLTGNLKSLKANLENNISIDIDKTFKVKNYNYDISGDLEKGKFELPKPFESDFTKEEIKDIYLSDFQIKSTIDPNNVYLSGEGKYSLDNSNFYRINIINNFKSNLINLKLNFDFKDNFKLGLINYEKSNNLLAKISLDLEKNEDIVNINKASFEEGNNLIEINDLVIKRNKFLKLKKLKVITNNNNFLINANKKILIKGTNLDASNLAKFFKKQSDINNFNTINGDIEIDLKNIKVSKLEKLQNFKLLGEIKNGQLAKISSKGEFGDDNFLDIAMKKNKNSNKRYLEIYSDLTSPFLAEYGFFNGLTGGKLLFTSIIDEQKSNSKLKIENFKVVNAPGVIKLLSMADLGGLADLVEGEGLSFDLLEITYEKNNDYFTLNEILALGPSMSVLMEGYQNKDLISLRGTLVPAKTLNKMISKIPVIGNIVIPKEVGEGLFGISFKMKGPKGKVKTTINPIRTLTPRFIQKIIEKKKTK